MLVMYVVLITEMSLVAVVQATVVDNLIELVLFRRAEGISKIMPLHLIRNQGDISVYDIVEFIEWILIWVLNEGFVWFMNWLLKC